MPNISNVTNINPLLHQMTHKYKIFPTHLELGVQILALKERIQQPQAVQKDMILTSKRF